MESPCTISLPKYGEPFSFFYEKEAQELLLQVGFETERQLGATLLPFWSTTDHVKRYSKGNFFQSISILLGLNGMLISFNNFEMWNK